MNWSSRLKHENRKCERDSHLRAPSGQSGAVRHFQICFQSLIRRGGCRRGRRHHSEEGVWGSQPPILISGKVRFNMEMPSKFPFCVPVAAGIVSVFIENHLISIMMLFGVLNLTEREVRQVKNPKDSSTPALRSRRNLKSSSPPRSSDEPLRPRRYRIPRLRLCRSTCPQS